MSAFEDRVPPPTGWSVDPHFHMTESGPVWRSDVLDGMRRLLIPDAALDAFTPAAARERDAVERAKRIDAERDAERERDAVERAKRVEAMRREGLAASERQVAEQARREAERKRVQAATAEARRVAREQRKQAELQEFRSRLKGKPPSGSAFGDKGSPE
jgi:hypothetical protein